MFDPEPASPARKKVENCVGFGLIGLSTAAMSVAGWFGVNELNRLSGPRAAPSVSVPAERTVEGRLPAVPESIAHGEAAELPGWLRFSLASAALAAAAGIATYLLRSVRFSVEAGTSLPLLRLGRLVGPLPAGVHWRFPYPVDRAALPMNHLPFPVSVDAKGYTKDGASLQFRATCTLQVPMANGKKVLGATLIRSEQDLRLRVCQAVQGAILAVDFRDLFPRQSETLDVIERKSLAHIARELVPFGYVAEKVKVSLRPPQWYEDWANELQTRKS